MDENLARLERIYPNGKYVLIAPYDPEIWKDRKYDSAFDNKGALNRWKTSPLNYEKAQEALEKGNRIGWIVPKGFVVVDIDNKDDPMSQDCVEKILDKFEVAYNYNYTSKGIHILFQDPTGEIKSDSHTKCGINIVIDTRANETGYIILPCNDPHREWGKWNDFVEEIPYFLKPITKDNTQSFIGLTDGDGRNNALFKWRTVLEKSNKLRKDEVEKCIRIINENVFDTPMSNQELFKTVLRQLDDKNTPGHRQERDNKYNEIADEILSRYDIVARSDTFYKYNGTYYEPIDDTFLEKLIHDEFNKNVSHAGRMEVIQFLKIKAQKSAKDFDRDWYKIACKNGTLNLVTGEVEQPNKSDLNTTFIPWEYNNDPEYSPRIDQFMKDLTGGDILKMEFLYQIAGYCLCKKNLFEKFIICRGEGGTGKSTYTNLLQKLVGKNNCSHIGLSDFNHDYYIATTMDKLLNVDDDVVDGRVLENTGTFKSFISGNTISARQIYKEPVEFTPFATLIFSCNRLPKIMDKTTGLYRRMILIELNHKIEKPDPLFMNKVTEPDMEYFLFKAVEGIRTAIDEGRFRITKTEEELLNIFKRRQSALNEWLYETEMCLGDLHEKECRTLFAQFKAWAEENGYQKLMNIYTFKEDMCAIYDMETDLVKRETGVPKMCFIKRGMFDPEYRPF